MGLALYRKYRPQSFDHLVGQDVVRVTLLNALKRGRLAHAYLFAGPRGTGKTSTARLIAKAIQCTARLESGEPCGKCDMCVLNASNDLIDVIEIDAASNRGIEDIRELRETLKLSPTRGAAKVYIIDEVHMLTKEAFNALLKSLEEPPAHVYFILATTELHKIPETIVSRCQRYDFKRVPVDFIVKRLSYIVQEEKIDAEPAALELLAKSADGGMRDAISLLEQFSHEALTEQVVRERLGLTHHQSCEELFAALGSGDTQRGLALIEQLHRDGFDLRQFTVSFLGLLRRKLHEAVEGDKRSILPKLLSWIDLFDAAWIKLKSSSITQLPLEIAVIRATRHVEAVVVEEKVEAKVGAPVAAASAPVQEKRPEGLLHLDAMKKRMPELARAIENPGVRMSFQTGLVKDMKGDQITLAFTSDFHLSKVKAPEALVAIETAFKKVTGRDFKIKFELDSGSMVPEMASAESLGWEVVEEDLA